MLALAMLMSACSGDSANGGDALNPTLRVLAAASFTDAMNDLADGFERQSAESGAPVNVELNLAGSATLREQIVAGAPGDVFASANSNIIDELDEAGELKGTPSSLAANSMVLITPSGNPGNIVGLDDLVNEDLLVGLCTPGVPCGDFAQQVLSQAQVEPAVDTFEDDVRSLVTRVVADELDAAIVYSSDVAAVGDAVEAIAIPPQLNIEAVSHVAVLRASTNPDLAQQFVDYLASSTGQDLLWVHGFQPIGTEAEVQTSP